jgi:hypothetical protein
MAVRLHQPGYMHALAFIEAGSVVLDQPREQQAALELRGLLGSPAARSRAGSRRGRAAAGDLRTRPVPVRSRPPPESGGVPPYACSMHWTRISRSEVRSFSS